MEKPMYQEDVLEHQLSADEQFSRECMIEKRMDYEDNQNLA